MDANAAIGVLLCPRWAWDEGVKEGVDSLNVPPIVAHIEVARLTLVAHEVLWLCRRERGRRFPISRSGLSVCNDRAAVSDEPNLAYAPCRRAQMERKRTIRFRRRRQRWGQDAQACPCKGRWHR